MEQISPFLQVDISPVLSVLHSLQARVDAQDKKIEEQRKVIEAGQEIQTSTRQLVQQFKDTLDSVSQRLSSIEGDIPAKLRVIQDDILQVQEKHSKLAERCDRESLAVHKMQEVSITAQAKTEEALASIPKIIQHEIGRISGSLASQQEEKFQQMTDIINARQEFVFDRLRAVETTLQSMPDQETFDNAAQNTAELEGIVRKAMGEVTKLQITTARDHDRVTSVEDSVLRLRQMVTSRFVSQSNSIVSELSSLTPLSSSNKTQEESETDRLLEQLELGDALLMTSEARRERAERAQSLVKEGSGAMVARSNQATAFSPVLLSSIPSSKILDLSAQSNESIPSQQSNLDWVAAREMDVQSTSRKIREIEDRFLQKLVEQRTDLDTEIRAESARVQQRFSGLARVLKGLHARVGELDTKRFSGLGSTLGIQDGLTSIARGSVSSDSSKYTNESDLTRDLDDLANPASEISKQPSTSTDKLTLPPIVNSNAQQQQQQQQQQLSNHVSETQTDIQSEEPKSAKDTNYMPVPPPVKQLGYQPPAGLKGLAAKRIAQHTRSFSMIDAPGTGTENDQHIYEQQLIQGLSAVTAREAALDQRTNSNTDAQLLKRYIDVGLREVKERLRKLEPSLGNNSQKRDSMISYASSHGLTSDSMDNLYADVVSTSRQYTDAWASYFADRLNAVEIDLAAFGVELPTLKDFTKQGTPASLAISQTEQGAAEPSKGHPLLGMQQSHNSEDVQSREHRILFNKLRKELSTMVQKARVDLAGAVLGPGAIRLVAEPRLEQQRVYLQSAAIAAASEASRVDSDKESDIDDDATGMKSTFTPNRKRDTYKGRRSNSRSRSRSKSPTHKGAITVNDTKQTLQSSKSHSHLMVAPVSGQSKGVPHFAASGLVVHKGPSTTLIGEDGRMYKGRQDGAVIFSPPSNSISGHFYSSVSRTPPRTANDSDSLQEETAEVNEGATVNATQQHALGSSEGTTKQNPSSNSTASPPVVVGRNLVKGGVKPRPIATHQSTSSTNLIEKVPHGPKALVSSLSTSGLLSGLAKR